MREWRREHLRQQEQLQYYLGFGYFLAPCVCLWGYTSERVWRGCAFSPHVFFLVGSNKQEMHVFSKTRQHLAY